MIHCEMSCSVLHVIEKIYIFEKSAKRQFMKELHFTYTESYQRKKLQKKNL